MPKDLYNSGNLNIDCEAKGVNSEKFIFWDHKVRLDFKRL